MTLKLITFDVTGTLLMLRLPVGHQYAQVASRYGVIAEEDKLSSNFRKVFKKLLIEHPNFGKSDIGWRQWWKKLVLSTFQDSLNQNINKSSIDKISEDLIEMYKTKECWKLNEGALSLLNKLRCKDIALGVISNYDPRLEDILKDLGVRKYFNFIVTSYAAKYQKPNQNIFKAVEELNKVFKKEEILHIGDNPELDFYGAKNVGWNALLIAEDLSKVSKSFPDIDRNWIVKDLNDVYQVLVSRNMLRPTS